MPEAVKEPVLKVRVGEPSHLLPTRELTLKGRFAWALKELQTAGSQGLHVIDRPALHWSHSIYRLRRDCLAIETIPESHSGPYAGSHARYVLRSPVQIIEGAMP